MWDELGTSVTAELLQLFCNLIFKRFRELEQAHLEFLQDQLDVIHTFPLTMQKENRKINF